MKIWLRDENCHSLPVTSEIGNKFCLAILELGTVPIWQAEGKGWMCPEGQTPQTSLGQESQAHRTAARDSGGAWGTARRNLVLLRFAWPSGLAGYIYIYIYIYMGGSDGYIIRTYIILRTYILHIYIYIHIYIYVCVYAHIYCIYIYVCDDRGRMGFACCKCVCINACINLSIYQLANLSINLSIHPYIYIYINNVQYILLCKWTCVYMNERLYCR